MTTHPMTYNGAVVHYRDALDDAQRVIVGKQHHWPRHYLRLTLAVPITEQGARAIAEALLAAEWLA